MKRFAVHSAGILAVATMTASCLPFYQTAYYHPEAASGIVTTGARCGGPPNRIELAAGRVRVSQIAWKTAHGMAIGMTIIVPPGNTVSLLERHVELTVPGGAERYHAPFEAVTLVVNRYPQPTQSIERPLVGDADPRDVLTRAGDRIRGTVYSLTTELLLPEADVMESKLPRFSVDGRMVELPKITLSRRTHTGFFEPINC
ncbi:MAG: hypothetical protein HYS36_05895 [Candidatus Rokubacteria bacterium]|nr:hypothetical protein [Candidatus Rokubacteria bacterium]